MSNDIMCGFVEKLSCPKILSLKVRLILLWVAAQSAQELEELSNDHKREPPVELSKQQWNHWTRLEQNLSYLVDPIEPIVLKLSIFDDFEKPSKFSSVMQAYRQTAEELRALENYVVPTYNAEPQLSKSGVEWNEVEHKFVKVQPS